MQIYYNQLGIPFIVRDGIIHDFTSQFSKELIAEIALDVELFNEIKTNVLNAMKRLASNIIDVEEEINVVAFTKKIEDIFYLSNFSPVLNILSEAEDIQYQIVNPQPYYSWQWDRLNKIWVPPISPPEGVSESNMQWDESLMQWIPTVPSPHEGWMWDWNTQTWSAPIAYPLGAEENEFVWSNELGTWVLNDQAG